MVQHYLLLHVIHHNSSVYTTDYEKKFTDLPRNPTIHQEGYLRTCLLNAQMSTHNVMICIELFAEAINRYIIISIFVA